MPILLKPSRSGDEHAKPPVATKTDSRATGVHATSHHAASHHATSPTTEFTSTKLHRTKLNRTRVSRYELASLTTQLAIMIRAGVDLVTALTSLQRQATGRGLKTVLAEVREDVLGGKSFSTALSRYEQTFGSTYIATVSAGEVAGELSQVLDQLAKTIRGEMRLRSSMRALLIYPLALVSVATIVIGCLIVFVLPKFAEIFGQFGTELPQATRFVLGIGTEFRVRLWLWLPVSVAAIAALVWYCQSPAGKRAWDKLLLSTAIFKRVGRPLMVGRACRLMGLMLASGVPLLDVIRLTRAGMSSHSYNRLFTMLEEEVLNGRGFSAALTQFEFIPTVAAEMLCTAEQTGTLADVAVLLADHFEELGEVRLKELMALLEPVVTVVMGILVAGVVLSVLLPMFDLSTLAEQGMGG